MSGVDAVRDGLRTFTSFHARRAVRLVAGASAVMVPFEDGIGSCLREPKDPLASMPDVKRAR